MKNLKIYFLFFILFSMYLNALSMVEVSEEKSISLLEHSDLYLDDKNLTKDVLTKGKYLKPYHKKNVNVGQSKSTVWIHFKLKNDSNQSIQKVLVLNSPSLEYIALYREKSQIPTLNGIQHKGKHSTIYYSYPINLLPHTTKEYYLEILSEHTSFYFNLTIQKYETFRDNDILKQAPRILMLGILFGLMIYAFLLAFYSRDRSYFYYGTYLLFTLWHQGTFLGLTQIYLPHWFVLFDMKLLIVKLGLVLVSSIFFVLSFLKIDSKSWLYKFYIMFLLLALYIIVFVENLSVVLIIGVVFILFNFISGIIIYRSGQKQARLFIVGFGVVSVAYMIIISDSFGFSNFLDYVPNILMWAVTIEVLVLSLAFADRYKILQELKEQSDKNREEIIKNEVTLKTEQLNRAVKTKSLLLKEVHHRVKNNLQIILSMIRLQSDKISEVDIKKKFLNLENRINAIAKTYNMLIVDENLDDIDMEEYIESLLLDIEDSMILYSNKPIELESHIEASLPLGKAVYIGIIINELVTNAYKYAFDKDIGKISVELYQKDKTYRLIITDNGKGFIYNENHNSLGLKLIHSLVLEQLKGNIEMETHPSSKYTITFQL